MQQIAKNILVVDDNATNLRLLVNILSSAGYVVRPARSGTIALASIYAALPDLILLDVMMPEMDGYEVCRRLKEDEHTRDIPVIFISALNDLEEKVKSFALGAVDYIPKPFHAEEVLARIHTHLTIRQLQNDLMDQIAELDAFAHTVAHDLKSPLALVTGFADLLIEDNAALTPEQQLLYLDKIQKAGRKAVNIIDELLLLASVHRQDVQLTPINMAQVLLQAQDRLYGEFHEDTEIVQPEKWPEALGYAPWLEEVWVNYLSNALKYGGRPLRLVLGAEPLADGQIRFWIRDNGPGISAQQQNSLFTEFVRISESKGEGYGLGLSIVRRIIEKLSGRVGVVSQEGEGSEFYFTLPAGGGE